MPTNAGQLVTEAKRLQRLLTQRRHAMKRVRDLNKEIALVRKHLKALARLDERDPFDQLPPFKWETDGK